MNPRSITAKELCATLKASRLAEAITLLANRLQRRNWKCNGQPFAWSGINWEKDYVLFFRCWTAGEGLAGYRYLRTPIADAMDCTSGTLDTIALP
jgi:hypothetical protein